MPAREVDPIGKQGGGTKTSGGSGKKNTTQRRGTDKEEYLKRGEGLY